MIAVRTRFDRKSTCGLDRLGCVVRSSTHPAVLPATTTVGWRDSSSRPPRDAEQLATDTRRPPGRLGSNWTLQLGTLGGGNHFIEVALDDEDAVWMFLHSGSRGVGHKIAMHHINVAQGAVRETWWFAATHRSRLLEEGTAEFDDYIDAIRWGPGVRAGEPRGDDGPIRRLLRKLDAGRPGGRRRRTGSTATTTIPGQSGTAVATSGSPARARRRPPGRPGVIPGSMGTRSYIVTGLRNPVALCSAPHGAGQAILQNRSKAPKPSPVPICRATMQGIEYRAR